MALPVPLRSHDLCHDTYSSTPCRCGYGYVILPGYIYLLHTCIHQPLVFAGVQATAKEMSCVTVEYQICRQPCVRFPCTAVMSCVQHRVECMSTNPAERVQCGYSRRLGRVPADEHNALVNRKVLDACVREPSMCIPLISLQPVIIVQYNLRVTHGRALHCFLHCRSMRCLASVAFSV